MQTNMCLDIEGIPGESEIAVSKDKIDIYGFEWVSTHGANMNFGNANAVGRAESSGIRIRKRVDLASHLLFINCMSGTYIKQATLIVRKTGNGVSLDFIKIQLTDVLVSEYKVGASDNDPNAHPPEEIVLTFGAVRYFYGRQKNDRALEPYKEVAWSTRENRRL